MLELVTFHIGDKYINQCVHVDISADSVPEGIEDFTLHVVSNDIQVYVPKDGAYVDIVISDERKYVYISKFLSYLLFFPCIGSAPECPELANPENGAVTISGLTPGSTADYVCDDGFAIVGPQRRVCQRNGEWTEEAPECICMCGWNSRVEHDHIR